MKQRHTRAAVLVMLGLMVAGALAACTGGGKPAVATAATHAAARPSPSGGQSQELAFVACMRSHGVANMPDPTPGDTSGRSAVKTALDQLGLGSEATFQAALDACQGLLPPPPAPTAPSTDQLAQELAFAKCMRDHGVTNFADPNPDGTWANSWIAAGDKTGLAAAQACEHLLPASQGPNG